MSDLWRLLALPPLDHGLLEALFGDPRVELITPADRTQEAVDALLPTADLVLGDWSPLLKVRDPGPRVAFIQQPSAGVDGIDLDACTARGVPVANCAGANATSVAEWCLSATLALLRRTVFADAAVRANEWPQTSLGGRELSGQRVGVVGMGAIGRRVATMFTGLGCQVSYWSRNQHPDAPAPYAELDDLLATSDIVILVIALGDLTRGLIDADRLARMKPGALLVNGARGEVVDEVALAAALTSGHLAGAGLDAFVHEPLLPDSPLMTAPNALLSPHMAGSTVEAAMRIVGTAKANLVRVLDGEPVENVVNGVAAAVTRRAGDSAT
ncbi:MAG: 3-phosphoglycerate dehydrogenase [Frankiales bacterium]|nr:3-phosphoglycerate dehydrogenase [Frankiales bacterium]